MRRKGTDSSKIFIKLIWKKFFIISVDEFTYEDI